MSESAMNKIICGDCLEVLPKLSKAKMIFADPPDNLGLKYNGFDDCWPSNISYAKWLGRVIGAGARQSQIFWLSYNSIYQPMLVQTSADFAAEIGYEWRQIIWRFTFGQHRDTDFANGYRPILRLMAPGAITYSDATRVQSQRQRNKDKRADPRGRVPDDVWDFPRVCGTFKEKRRWHPNQHPEALIERIVKFSCMPGDLVIDMFAGTSTVNRVCKRLGITCVGIEISKFYCEKIAEDSCGELTLR